MKIEKFEDIKVWQKSRELTRLIYSITNKELFLKDFGLKNQIQRAAVSIMSNIEEGFSRQSNKEFKQFLYISLGFTSEVKSQLYVALDLNYISQEEFDNIFQHAVEISKMLTKFIQYLSTDN